MAHGSSRKRRDKAIAKGRDPRSLPVRPPEALIPTTVDRQIVMLCSALGLSQPQIARQVRYEEGGISLESLLTYFRDELEAGAHRMNMNVARNLYRIATDKSLVPSVATAAIFWLKAKANWRDRTLSLKPGPDGLLHPVPEGSGDEDGDGEMSVKVTFKIA